jgi:hypothetical protein
MSTPLLGGNLDGGPVRRDAGRVWVNRFHRFSPPTNGLPNFIDLLRAIVDSGLANK